MTTMAKPHRAAKAITASTAAASEEFQRLDEANAGAAAWRKWGAYLSERQWGTVREDYSPDGACWGYFSHDQARSRAYRWGEDGLLGITDDQNILCFALAVWNRQDPILKERLFGLTGPDGNHGEDVKEDYFYLDATPTGSYLKGLYKYPQGEYPYARLVEESARRSRDQPELELRDTGVFDSGRVFDVQAEYAKAGPEDVLIRITVKNCGPEAAVIDVLPTLWFRNTWSWGRTGEEGHWKRPVIHASGQALIAEHEALGRYALTFSAAGGAQPEAIFTENETNTQRLFASPNTQPFVKDAFHRYVINGEQDAVNTERRGSKATLVYRLTLGSGEHRTISLRLTRTNESKPSLGAEFDELFERRMAEAAAWHRAISPPNVSEDDLNILRQARAGLLWSKQFYHYSIPEWIGGDPSQPAPPRERRTGRNAEWRHFNCRDILSMPDKWEYPWFAAWDLAFHMIPMAKLDPQFAKDQLVLMLREWYMHPNGQLPAYEFAFGDVNPPVHAWAAWRVYKMTAERGKRDRVFLARVFQKLLINFTWWINRKDPMGRNLFAGGFLGLDNIGVFDRSRPLPTGGHLEQADGTAWMAFFCGTMLSMALELAKGDPAYEDVATKFFEHFVAITDAMNSLGGTGLWDEHDGFYYDQLIAGGKTIPLRVRSMVGLVPLFACEVLDQETIDELPDFAARMKWFIKNRADLCRHIAYAQEGDSHEHRLLAIPSRERLIRTLNYFLDENEFLSPHGVRSLSAAHRERPYVFQTGGEEYRVDYTPGESTTALFGGNSNWRGPIWFPLNYLFIESLERYHHFYGDSLKVECPTGSGRFMNLSEVAAELGRRLCSLFQTDAKGNRPCHAGDPCFAADPNWNQLLLFHEYFHGDTGKGLGASHQTGWTALVLPLLERLSFPRSNQ